MPKKLYIVDLSPAERDELLALTSKGTVRARQMKRAQILLKAADGTKTLKSKRILIATGSAPTELPGLAFDGKYIDVFRKQPDGSWRFAQVMWSANTV